MMSLNPVTELIQPLPKVIAPNPVIDCTMPPQPEECILRAFGGNKDGSTAEEYRNFIDNPDPSNDFIDAVIPQTLRDPLINLPSFNQVNDSAINPQPFINFDPEKKTSNLPNNYWFIIIRIFYNKMITWLNN